MARRPELDAQRAQPEGRREFTAEHADNEGSRVFNRPIYTFPGVFDFAADSPSRQDNLAIDPNTGDAVTNLLREHRTNSIAGFVQDEWKVRPNLTLNLGLRYEGYSNVRDSAGDVTAIEFASRSGSLQQDLATATLVERQYCSTGGSGAGPYVRTACKCGLGSDKRRTYVAASRHRPLLRANVEPALGLGVHEPPGIRSDVGDIFDPVKPVFGLGSTPEKPYNYPRPSGLTAG